MTDQRLMEVCANLHTNGAWPGSLADLLDRLEAELDKAERMCVCGKCGEEVFLTIAINAIVAERSRQAVLN